MKTISGCPSTFLQPVPEGTSEWYYSMGCGHGDLYEEEELFQAGEKMEGNRLCLVRYPDGEVFEPVPRKAGAYFTEPVFLDGGIYCLNVDFPLAIIRIFRFDCSSREVEVTKELPLSSVRDCYNLRLHTAPLSLTRQGGADNLFEIIWPDKVCFEMGEHESFFLRSGDKLYFNRWYEEGEGTEYRYWEETVIRNLQGEVTEVLPGDVRIMPNGEMWYIPG